MDTATDTVLVDRELPFTSVHGEPLPVGVGELRRKPPAMIEVTFRLDYDTWLIALEEGAFHLDSVTVEPELRPGRPVELRTRLRPALANRVESLTALPDRFADSNDPLRHTDSWFVTAIHQEVELSDALDIGVGPDTEATGRANMGVETAWDGFLDERPHQVEEAVTDHFEGNGWEYDRLEEGLFHIDITIGGRSVPIYIYTNEDDREWLLCAVHPARVPDDRRDEITPTLARRNYELERGAFGLDPANGEVRFRVRGISGREPFADVMDLTVAEMASVFEDVLTCTGAK